MTGVDAIAGASDSLPDVPHIARRLWRDPGFRKRLTITLDTPLPDHDSSSTVPGCSRFPAAAEFQSPRGDRRRTSPRPNVTPAVWTPSRGRRAGVRDLGDVCEGRPRSEWAAGRVPVPERPPDEVEHSEQAQSDRRGPRPHDRPPQPRHHPFERDAWMVARELYRAGEHFLAVRWLSGLPPEHPIWRTADEGSLATLYLVIWSQEGGKTRADVLPRLTSLWRSLFPGSWDSAPDPA